MTRIRFRLFGPLEIDTGTGVVDAGHARQAAVLAVLLLEPGRVVTVADLVHRIHSGGKTSSPATIHTYVSRLRTVLKPAGVLIEQNSGGYAIGVRPEEVDVHVFRDLLDRARADRSTATGHLAQALALWRGAAFAAIASDWLTGIAAELEDERITAFEDWAQGELDAGHHRNLIRPIRHQVQRYPLNTRLVELLMITLYRAGRSDEALAVYSRYAEQVGRRPGHEVRPNLRRLQHRILICDESLDPDVPRSPAAPAPWTLPRDVNLVGRGVPLARLDRLLPSQPPVPQPVAVISGPPGVGKTALAVHWAYRKARLFPDGCLYADLHGFGPTAPSEPDSVLDGFLTALGVAPSRLPASHDAKTSLYRTLVHHRRILVILDNAGSTDQIRTLLPGGTATTVLVISRQPLRQLAATTDVLGIALGPLSPQDSTALLHSLVDPHLLARHRQTLEQLRQACGGLPIALRLAAAAGHGAAVEDLPTLAAALAASADTLSALDPDGTMAAAFSWSYRTLPPDAAALFRLLGLHVTNTFDVPTAAALGGVSIAQAGQLLDVMCNAGLVDRSRDRHRLHDLLHEYAMRCAEADEPVDRRTQAQTRMIDHYTAAATRAMDVILPAEQQRRSTRTPDGAMDFPHATAARAWLAAERSTLLDVARLAAESGAVAQVCALAMALFRFLDHGGHLADAATIAEAALSAARHGGDRRAEAEMLIHLGAVRIRSAAYADAAELLRQALDLSTDLGSPHGRARALGNLARISARTGDLATAVARHREAIAGFVAAADLLGQARARTNLGIVLSHLDRLDEAEHELRQAVALARELSVPDSEARALGSLASILQRRGRLREAADGHFASLQIFDAIEDRIGAAVARANLGIVRRDLGDPSGASVLQRDALAEFRAMGDRKNEAEVLNDLALSLTASGQADEARARHLAALEVAVEIGDQREQLRGSLGLARLAAAGGDLDEARRHLREARQVHDGRPGPSARELADLEDELGDGSAAP
ncbi:AfsR/SARP family transcriptional regulator [Catellatospora tritici]|uniref:AfsR/SARP family transcriptional regulator n=1 Tax=Catellatospora tritici TaxID=2851566 RepID=UPI001C2D4D33|nr:BTAD domain-containing putative transcriptional regulator [Catellatospora tritici]MBV1855811.1 tetratricopeptide repeat protein [Catellatospora tritici]